MKAILLLSGGIDSPVAGYLMKQKGVDVIPLTLDNFPYSNKEATERAIDAARALRFKKMYVVPHGQNQREFLEKGENKYVCVLCRRMMFRIASELAKRLGADALITGENLGQVASQTLQNMYTMSQASDVPIIRPVVGMDKNEIIRIAEEIGTFKISIHPAICCTHIPKKPSTAADLERIVAMEAKLDIAGLMEKSFDGMREVVLGAD